MKFRIQVYEDGHGTKCYVPQRRVWGIWMDLKYYFIGGKQFDTEQEAAHMIQYNVNRWKEQKLKKVDSIEVEVWNDQVILHS